MRSQVRRVYSESQAERSALAQPVSVMIRGMAESGCQYKLQYGRSSAPTAVRQQPNGVFKYFRVEAPEDLPPADLVPWMLRFSTPDHGWPNLGHDSLVHAVREIDCDLRASRWHRDNVAAISFDVRRKQMLPAAVDASPSMWAQAGRGIDPRMNDRVSVGCQGIKEDPTAWERPLICWSASWITRMPR